MAVIDQPPTDGSTSDPPAVELVGQTRHTEARIAIATAAGLVEHGISPSDIVITAVDLDPYEDLLERAARRYGLTLAVWTPLNLKRTSPYQFAASLVAALHARSEESIPIEPLVEPLRLGWVPPQQPSVSEPLPAGISEQLIGHNQGPTRTLLDWTRQIADSELNEAHKRHVIAYLNWLGKQPQKPSPDAVSETLISAMDGYETAVLPSQAGSKPVSELANTLRGFDRTIELLETAQQRYGKWLDYGRVDRSWAILDDLLDSFATTLPGRRELPTAAAIDVKEANDMWALAVPYVIIVGLVDAECPRSIESAISAASRAAIGHTETTHSSGLRPHSSWTPTRDLDHFVSAASAASELLVTTRFGTDADGVDQHPSRFLEAIETTPVTEGVDDLIADPTLLPDVITDCVPLEDHQ